ncbi:AMP-binding protein [Saccharothrix obliqua]|uniref:AMP-binding protein n=1 Tax=Saccharothrix obliqua TaxID=2861747 RepID=UPI001C5CE052|nr:AMP-binding protein [Saccharothrix obliqua]MBW4721864.1 AMP-binding protein [Saccharothrix obliqua]
MTAPRRPSTADQPATPAQQGLWFLHELLPDSALNTCFAYDVTGPLDVDALRAAWRTLLRRHDALRYSVREVGGLPVLDASGPGADAVVVDLAGDAAAAERRRAEIAATPFDLAAGGPVTLTVLRVHDRRHLVVLAAHRLVADESSLAVLVDELGRYYADPGTHLPPAPRFTDRGPVGEEAAALRRWWRAALAAGPAPAAVPADRVRPAEPSRAAGEIRFDWGPDLGRALAERSAAEGAAPEVFLLAGFLALLSRYGGERRVSVGHLVDARPIGGRSERVVGPFGNLVLVDADVDPTASFGDLARHVDWRRADALAHRQLPYSDVVRLLGGPRAVDRIPLCDTTFAVETVPELWLPGLVAHGTRVGTGGLLTDVALTVEPVGTAVRGRLEYRENRYDATTAAAVLAQWRTLLTAALRHPATPVGELPLETPGQTAAAVRAADFVGSAPEPRRPVHVAVREQAAHLPDAPAVSWQGEVVTYAELTTRAGALAARLRPGGGPVAVRVPTGPEHVVALLGAFTAGGHVVCLGGGVTGGRDREILAELRPPCLVVADAEDAAGELARWYRDEIGGQVVAVADAVPDAEPDPVVPAPRLPSAVSPGSAPPDRVPPGSTSGGAARGEAHGGPRSAPGSVLGVRPRDEPSGGDDPAAAPGEPDDEFAGLRSAPGSVLGVGPGSTPDSAPHDQSGGVGPRGDTPDDEPDDEPGDGPVEEDDEANGLDDLAYIVHTSGSTGRPKGIAHTHASFAQFVDWVVTELGIGPGARVAQWSAPGYDASLCQIFTPLVAGATLCPVPDKVRVDPRKLVRWLVDERVTLFETVPSFARQLLKALRERDPELPRPALRQLLLAGEPLPGDLAGRLRAELPGVRLINLYGPTEAILATWHDVTTPVRGMVPIGRPLPGRQVLVLDDHDRPCAPGVPGQLVIRSPYVTTGYVGGGGERAFRRLRDDDPLPCYRTGDIGRQRWDGLLEFQDRRDAQVKFFGNRLELTSLEAALTDHPSVAQCAIVPVVDGDGLVLRLAAHVVPEPTAPREAAALAAPLRAHLRERFGTATPPMAFTAVADLPRTASGKLDRRRLPAPPAAPAVRAAEAVEAAVAALWTELVGTTPAPDDSLFAHGGHSLLLLHLLDRVHARFGVRIHLRDCLARPTVAEFAALVAAADVAAARTTTNEQ